MSKTALALSLLITEITGLPASEVFFQNIYKTAEGADTLDIYTVSQARKYEIPRLVKCEGIAVK